MSIFRFKSRETGDLVMLKPHGELILQALGKDPSGPGIIQPAEMGGAAQALRAAADAEAAEQQRLKEEALARGEPAPEFDPVTLRHRIVPFIEMMQRCEQAQVEIVWGV